MATIDLRKYCSDVRGKFGYIHGSKPKRYTDVYRVVHINNKPICEKFAYTAPHNPKTPKQLSQQAKYKSGCDAWKVLNQIEKDSWKFKARYRNMSGYNFFMKFYLEHN
jgi:hypothetical protein